MEASMVIIAATALILCFGLTEPAPADFIHSSCKVTQYPNLCEKYLSGYSQAALLSPRQLAQAALTVTADRAVAASTFLQRMSVGGKRSTSGGSYDGGAVSDCVETLGDSVERLRRSVKEMERVGRLGSRSFERHLSNVKTWVSAALTDENTCIDSLSQDKLAAGVRVQVRRQIVPVLKMTSNALALVNRLDSPF